MSGASVFAMIQPHLALRAPTLTWGSPPGNGAQGQAIMTTRLNVMPVPVQSGIAARPVPIRKIPWDGMFSHG
jgi:hypothetical protein